ncbi:hypothetical protein Pmani_035812 [Petrolisthes manimaculis]|uniref:Uncharacterized protein n=1 Tax=Petrolisthes manimaculis TaxID=1843537 RepID=A0AAE1NLK0_9EUCA|nr:hypothetical protein Pmani_035812 [Petrolisthes manimaculis]
MRRRGHQQRALISCDQSLLYSPTQPPSPLPPDTVPRSPQVVAIPVFSIIEKQHQPQSPTATTTIASSINNNNNQQQQQQPTSTAPTTIATSIRQAPPTTTISPSITNAWAPISKPSSSPFLPPVPLRGGGGGGGGGGGEGGGGGGRGGGGALSRPNRECQRRVPEEGGTCIQLELHESPGVLTSSPLFIVVNPLT